MKLILCRDCWDVLKLKQGEMRYCECKKVYGRYLDNEKAEVSETAVSLAIGNGSLAGSVHVLDEYNKLKVRGAKHLPNDRDDWIEMGKVDYCWVRPNEGPGNPHTSVIKE